MSLMIIVYKIGGKMKTYSYKKIYPFERSVFGEKFSASTISLNTIKATRMTSSNREKNGRVFLGSINNNKLMVLTYFDVDLETYYFNRQLFRERVFTKLSPMCIYGIISEDNGQTIVDYSIEKRMEDKGLAINLRCILVIIDLGMVIGTIVNGFTFNLFDFFALFILAFFHIFIFFTLKISQTEVDALIKFMNDLEL